jgi:hypothetical protein
VPEDRHDPGVSARDFMSPSIYDSARRILSTTIKM